MFVRCTSGEAREAMKLLLVLALLFRATHADAAFGAPRAQGLLPRGPRAGHAVRLPRRPIAPLTLRVASTDEQDPQVTTQRVRRPPLTPSVDRPALRPSLAHHPSLDPALQDGRTALQVAVGLGHAPMVKKLIEAGADVNKPTKVGRLGEAGPGQARRMFATSPARRALTNPRPASPLVTTGRHDCLDTGCIRRLDGDGQDAAPSRRRPRVARGGANSRRGWRGSNGRARPPSPALLSPLPHRSHLAPF